MHVAASVLMLFVGASAVSAESASEKPQYEYLPHPTVEQIQRGLRQWARKHPDRMKVEVRGRTNEHRPMLLCRITDYNVPDEDKEHALFTTCHASYELNSVTASLHLIKWLISDDPLAAEIRRKQVVLVMPNCNPDGYSVPKYGNTVGGDPYVGPWTWGAELNAAEKNPEAVAIKGVIDQYMPEVHYDIHGVWYEGQTMWEEVGFSWASGLCRPYIARIWERIREEAEKAGFFMTAAEESSGKIRVTAPVPGAEDHFYLVGTSINDMLYSYNRYHTIPIPNETGFDESAVVRARALLKLGLERWRGEYYAGYPTRQVMCWLSTALAAYGTTAAQRRASRVELWQKLGQITLGAMHPEPIGQIMCFCATTPEGAQKYLAETELVKWVEQFKDEPQFDYKALRQFVYSTKAVNLMPQSGAWPGGSPSTAEESERLRHGLALRLLVPYPNPKITDVRLDGHEIPLSESDGYIVYHEPGTTVQVNIPPEKVRDFHVATLTYEPDVKRKCGFGPEDWRL